MSEQQEMMTPVPADKPTTRRRSLLRGVAVSSLTLLVMVAGVALYLTGRGMLAMDTRLATLEQQQRERLTPAALAPLQSRLSELEAKLQTESARLAQLARQPVLTASQQTQLNELPASLEQIQAAQKALSLRLDTLAALAEKSQSRAVQSESPSASGTGKKDVSGTKEPSPVVQKIARPATARSGTPHTSRYAPFVLTGTERRGALSYAAVAPRGYTSLSQVALLGEGESVAGWTLIHAGHEQATFRVNGRPVQVRVE
ncbi:TPA: Tat (twin-arginine translocation) pathway signal sequence [Escherichia coli]|uniref:Tat (Twin-arginine translocation) pathway signal sequence n=1 Tax=Escherichia marmotae TaxID=1499973 RepID=A0A7Z9CX00_9ESCH|nr:Tat (twin-arginine translocation) pathway signal sequence [Escherichia marmotae]EFA4889130.1 Tat (twin-arginine translocation) pathway signal sequence [Escherichia coli]EFK7859110.1 Tat (twin-arginine translocation) pathway signal sequence [Escherichia coli]EFM5248361.1 Tat (twin-arginine translocation) pathway signal sequence [Escherichia coli]EGD4401231.1 Tat (twin-arginine translocation) pathway signal sequence [Escherichia coli]EGH1375248.1 Tat (twin-arginine translocation) pathway sign